MRKDVRELVTRSSGAGSGRAVNRTRVLRVKPVPLLSIDR
jgi:hypothetical protein